MTRTALTTLLALAVLAPQAALAGECEDDFAECKDDCLIQYGGSIRVEMKKKYDKCLKKCSKAGKRCTERQLETKSNNLDEGALDNAPTSDQVDSEGLPTREAKASKTSDKAGKKAAKEAPAAYEDSPAEEAPPAPKREALAEDEVPKSSRTSLKVDEKQAPSPEPVKKEEPQPRPEPKSEKPAEEQVIKMTPKKDDGRSSGDDLRDDGPREDKPAEEEAPRPKRREKQKEPPPKKEEDHDDLRYF